MFSVINWHAHVYPPKELERRIRACGLKGCFINSSHDGRYPDEESAWGFTRRRMPPLSSRG